MSRTFVQDEEADSSCECEYYAYTAGVKDIESLQLQMVVLQGQGLNTLTSSSGCAGIMLLENWCSLFSFPLISRLQIFSPSN